MRAFIAISLPEGVRRRLARQQEAFRSALNSSQNNEGHGVKWAPPDGIHLTLKFLGEITEAKVQQVIAGLTPLGDFPSIALEVRGFDCFPDFRRPRVFWAGVVAPPALRDLAARIEAAMAKLGFPSEARSFSPHLTLARFSGARPRPGLESLARESGEWTSGQFEVSRFSLFESKLSAGAPAEYLAVANFAKLQA
ncbi:MAG: RNA 2',3'-cyclic phosphodiesterase, partial [Terriglobia bacterium]